MLGKKAIIGYSTHTIDQARAAGALPVNYIAFGPIFATGSKENPEEVVGLQGLRAAREAGTRGLTVGSHRRYQRVKPAVGPGSRSRFCCDDRCSYLRSSRHYAANAKAGCNCETIAMC